MDGVSIVFKSVARPKAAQTRMKAVVQPVSEIYYNYRHVSKALCLLEVVLPGLEMAASIR